MLEIAYPAVAARTCDDCIAWIFNTETGYPVFNKQTGEPIRRPFGTRPPCLSCPKCASEEDRTPEVGRTYDLSNKNRLTLKRYWEFKVVGGEVDDITRSNFGIIEETIERYNRRLARQTVELLASIR